MDEVNYTFRFNGSDYFRRGDEASRRAGADIINEAIQRARFYVYVVTGATQRTIHAAPRGYSGDDDLKRAKKGEDLSLTYDVGDMIPTQGVSFGSWAGHAAIEDERRPFVTPAWEEASAMWEDFLNQRFRQAGLSDK